MPGLGRDAAFLYHLLHDSKSSWLEALNSTGSSCKRLHVSKLHLMLKIYPLIAALCIDHQQLPSLLRMLMTLKL